MTVGSMQKAREHSVFSYPTQADNFSTNRLCHFCLQGTEFRCFMGFRILGASVIFRESDGGLPEHRNEHFTSFTAASGWLNLKKCGQELWDARPRPKPVYPQPRQRQPVAGSTKVGNRAVSGKIERKNDQQTVLPDDRSAMTMINETLQPEESFAGRGKKVKSFGSKASDHVETLSVQSPEDALSWMETAH